MKRIILLLAAALAFPAFAEDPTSVRRELRNVGCEGTDKHILDLEGRYPTAVEIDDLVSCRQSTITFVAPFDGTEERWLWGTLDRLVLYSACDDAETCGKRIKEECAKEGTGIKAQKVDFDSTSKTPCTGRCTNGQTVSITCIKVPPAPKPAPVAGIPR